MKDKGSVQSVMIVLALVLLIQVPAAWAAVDQSEAVDPQVSAAPVAPEITLWYGDSQSFGVLGNPQKQINILGNVQGADELYYRLNSDSEQDWKPLNMGKGGTPDPEPPSPSNAGDPWETALLAGGSPRLIEKGDFDVEIFNNELLGGDNKVDIKAVKVVPEGADVESTKTVTVNYTTDTTWPLPYSVDWSEYDNILDVVQDKTQIVDGQWDMEDGWLVPLVVGYDRTVAVGDINWENFDVKVLLHLKKFPSEDEGSVGILTRWDGHHPHPDRPDEQPLSGWWDSGVFARYKHREKDPLDPTDCGSRLEMYYGRRKNVVDEDCEPKVRRNEPYYMRLRVQTKDSAPHGLYSFRIWPSSKDEPDDWVFEQADESPEWLPTGSVLLVAHEADVHLGAIEVLPIFDVTTATVGNGAVAVDPELSGQSDAYLYGDTIELTATPADNDWAFAGWSGDLTSYQNPVTLTLESDVSITATFAPKRTLDLTVSPTVGGQVDLDPPGGVYGNGTTVKLTPKPNTNWIFDEWSGPNKSELVNLGDGSWSLLMDSDKSVTANFVPGYSLTITTSGEGSAVADPPGPGYPSGTVVQLTAEPDWGWAFDQWQGDAQGTNNPTSVTMDGDKAVQAVFEEVTYAFLPVVRKRAR